MGVFGITRWIDEAVVGQQMVPETLIAPRSRLIVDGSAFAFHVVSLLGDAAKREIVGDYGRINDCVKQVVEKWMRYGLTVVVVADGKPGPEKLETIRLRREEAWKKHFKVYEYLVHGRQSTVDKEDGFPTPMLFLDEIYGCLNTLAEVHSKNLLLIQAPGEADDMIAQVSGSYLKRGMRNIFVVSSDSDFLFTNNIYYLPLKYMRWDENDGGSLKGIVFTTDLLADLLNIGTLANKKTLLTDLACCLGNDYTSKSKKKRMKSEDVLLVIDKVQRGQLDVLQNASKDTSYELIAKSYANDDESLVKAIATNNAGMNCLRVENDFMQEGEEEQEGQLIGGEEPQGQEEAQEVIVLSMMQNLTLKDVGNKNEKELSEKEVVQIVKRIAREAVHASKGVYAAHALKTHDATTEEGILKHFYSLVEEATLNMYEAHGWHNHNAVIQQNFNRLHAPSMDSMSLWDQYCMALAFQFVVKWFFSQLGRQSKLTLLPSDLYHGPTFFPGLMSEEQKQTTAASVVPATPKTPQEQPQQPKTTSTPSSSLIPSSMKIKQARIQRRRRPTNRPNRPQSQQRSQQKATEPKEVVDEELPIDAHRETILRTIRNNRITIIHAETGAGKSSRTPMMLLEELGERARIMISQPRRIAARSLFDRVRSLLGKDKEHLVGLRMGGGVREEGEDCSIYYVTTGYMVRKLASDPKFFNSFTHLILDEIHERSVDMDVLCLLVKRLMESNSRIRLVLMSATVQAKLFRKYFNLDQEPLFVGSKRFPLQFHFLDSPELIGGTNYLGDLGKQVALQALQQMSKIIKVPPLSLRNTPLALRAEHQMLVPKKIVDLQYTICVDLVSNLIDQTDSAILVFVSGMQDILQLSDKFDEVNLRRALNAKKVKCIPIHSSIPYEEQRLAWESVEDGYSKVILATNSAESSITLPDVDIVVCFGTRRQVEIDGNNTLLVDRWVSQASATQRAGRTGRVKPGMVFRLYSEELFEAMLPFDLPEIHCSPLDKVILELKNLIDGPVIPLLQALVDPPDIGRAHLAMASLFDLGLVDTPDDETCKRTGMGKFVGLLGVDLKIGVLVGQGAMLGCLEEAIGLAAVMSIIQSPFRVATPLIHRDPYEYHGILINVLTTQYTLGGGGYSEPLTLLRLLSIWEHSKSATFRKEFCLVGGLAWIRMSRMSVTQKHLRQLVERTTRRPKDSLLLPHPTVLFTDPKRFQRIRLLLLLANGGNLMSLKSTADPSEHDAPINCHDIDGKYASVSLGEDSEDISIQELQHLFPPGVSYFLRKREIWASQFSWNVDISVLRGRVVNAANTWVAKAVEDPFKMMVRELQENGAATGSMGEINGPCVVIVFEMIAEDMSSDEEDFDYFDGDYNFTTVQKDQSAYICFSAKNKVVEASFIERYGKQWLKTEYKRQGTWEIPMKVAPEEDLVSWMETFPSFACVELETGYRDSTTVDCEIVNCGKVTKEHIFALTMVGVNPRTLKLNQDQKKALEKMSSRIRVSRCEASSTIHIRNEDAPGMFRDVPFGYKLLCAYANGNRPRTVINVNMVAANGEMQYETKQIQLNLTETVFEPEPISIPACLKMDSGVGLFERREANVFLRSNTVKSIFASQYALEKYALPIPQSNTVGAKEKWYAVAGSITFIAKESTRFARSATATMLTLFEETFVRYGLVILGSKVGFLCPDKQKAGLAMKVNERLWDLTIHEDKFFQTDDTLVQWIDELFEEFTFTPAPLPPDYYEHSSPHQQNYNYQQVQAPTPPPTNAADAKPSAQVAGSPAKSMLDLLNTLQEKKS